MSEPGIAIVIPTRNRAEYLDVTLESLAQQNLDRRREVVVVDDGSQDDTRVVAERKGATYVRHERSLGINAARNAGIRASAAPLLAFVDDDVSAAPCWLGAIIDGAASHPEADAFGGPIRARFEGRTPSSCGRDRPPITTLDLGPEDIEVPMVWGANMAIWRKTFDRMGPFDEAISGHGDEEDWLLALRAAGGRIVYLAEAAVDHRRVGRDARLPALARAEYHRGRGARITDERRNSAPTVLGELRTLAGCAWHTVRYRCPQGPIMGAHSAGRLAEALRRT